MGRRREKDVAKLLAEEAALAEQDRDARVRYRRVGRPPKPPSERGQVYSIRIPVERLEDLRRVAQSRGKPAAVLARDWILDRLSSETTPRQTVMRSKSRAGESAARYEAPARRSAAGKAPQRASAKRKATRGRPAAKGAKRR